MPATSPAQPAAPAAAAFNPAIQAQLDALRLSGVRLAGDRSRILVNGQVYGIGDPLLENGINVKVFAIAPREIIFVDESGIQYIKRF